MDKLLGWAMLAAWCTAVITDLIHSRALMIGIDIFIFPLGVIRGLLIWLGVI
jgi:hypothetical protein